MSVVVEWQEREKGEVVSDLCFFGFVLFFSLYFFFSILLLLSYSYV